jgi:hypothetical protein
MKNNCTSLLTSLLICIILTVSNNAQAGLIEADYLTSGDELAVYDEDTGLSWLDMTETLYTGYEEASSTIAGYRMATQSEITELFNNAFGELSYDSYGIYNDYDEGIVKNFIELFGVTFRNDTLTTIGYYLDDDGVLSMTKVSLWDDGDENPEGYLTRINGTSYEKDLPDFYYENGSSYFGFYMVKDSVSEVPEPNMFLLFLISFVIIVTTNRYSPLNKH